MSSSVNKVILIGNVGKDPDIRSTQEGREIANIALATSEKWKDKITGERKEKTEWHRIVIFSEGLVQVVKNYVKKGTKLYIEGSLQTRKWTDNSGIEKYSTEVVLQGFSSVLTMLDTQKTGSSSDDNNYSSVTGNNNQFDNNYKSSNHDDILEDEIPF